MQLGRPGKLSTKPANAQAAQQAAQRAAEEAARRAAEAAAKRAAEEAARKAAEASAKQQTEAVKGGQGATEPKANVQRLSEAAKAGPGATEQTSGAQRLSEAVKVGQDSAELISGAQRLAEAAKGGGALPWVAGEQQAYESTLTPEETATYEALPPEQKEQRANAYAKMNSDQQTQYQELPPENRESFMTVVTDPAVQMKAEEEMFELLEDGIFKQHPDLLASLEEMTAAEVDGRYGENAKRRLIEDTLSQIADPGEVEQDPRYETCGFTSMERQLLKEDPARYVEMITTLAKGENYALEDGKGNSLVLMPPDESVIAAADKGKRSMASIIFQQSFQGSFLGGVGAHAASLNGINAALEGRASTKASEFEKAWQVMFPDQKLITFGSDQAKEVVPTLKSGDTVILDTGTDTAHATQVRVFGDKVAYEDEHGMPRFMSKDEFAQKLRGAIVPADSDLPDTEENFDVGAGGGNAMTRGSAARTR